MGVVRDIYNFVEEHFPYYEDLKDGKKAGDVNWKKSMRHTIWVFLRKNLILRHVAEGQTKTIYSYSFTTSDGRQKMIEFAQKHCRKRQDQIKRCMRRPELFE